MRAKLYRSLIRLINGPATSRILLKFAYSDYSKFLIKPYAKFYQINLEEMHDDIKSYPSLHAFFTRRLKAQARSIDSKADTVSSPVDGVLEDCGEISPTSEIIVKGKRYSIAEMLGGTKTATTYIGGTYMILYLSPAHYHRIHSPADSEVISTYSIGERSFPVNRLGLKYGDAALSKNFRVVTELKHHNISLAMVKVGAMFINSVEMVNHHREWKKGEEVAYFSFGSTVILIFEKETFQLEETLTIPSEVRMGEKLGKFLYNK